MSLGEHVNFLPKDLRRGRGPELQEILIGSWLLGLISMAAVTAIKLHQVNAMKQEYERLQEVAKSMETSTQEISSKAKSADNSNRTLASTKDFLDTRTASTEILKELSLIVPRSVWLTSFSEKLDQDKLSIDLVGESPSQAKVANLLELFEGSYYFHDVAMKTSEKLPDVSPSLYRFSFQVVIPAIKKRGTDAKN